MKKIALLILLISTCCAEVQGQLESTSVTCDFKNEVHLQKAGPDSFFLLLAEGKNAMQGVYMNIETKRALHLLDSNLKQSQNLEFEVPKGFRVEGIFLDENGTIFSHSSEIHSLGQGSIFSKLDNDVFTKTVDGKTSVALIADTKTADRLGTMVANGKMYLLARKRLTRKEKKKMKTDWKALPKNERGAFTVLLGAEKIELLEIDIENETYKAVDLPLEIRNEQSETAHRDKMKSRWNLLRSFDQSFFVYATQMVYTGNKANHIEVEIVEYDFEGKELQRFLIDYDFKEYAPIPCAPWEELEGEMYTKERIGTFESHPELIHNANSNSVLEKLIPGINSYLSVDMTDSKEIYISGIGKARAESRPNTTVKRPSLMSVSKYTPKGELLWESDQAFSKYLKSEIKKAFLNMTLIKDLTFRDNDVIVRVVGNYAVDCYILDSETGKLKEDASLKLAKKQFSFNKNSPIYGQLNMVKTLLSFAELAAYKPGLVSKFNREFFGSSSKTLIGFKLSHDPIRLIHLKDSFIGFTFSENKIDIIRYD